MKKPILFLFWICILIPGISKSQSYQFIYYLNAELVSVPKEKALIIGKGFHDEKLFRLDCFLVNGNYVLISMHFTDSSLAHLEGPYKSYYANGKIEKAGYFKNEAEEGVWFKYDSLGRRTDSIFYRSGLAFRTVTYDYHKEGVSLSYYTIEDSLQNTYQTTSFNEDGSVSSEVFFKGQRGILKKYSTSGMTTDSLFTREETEATFPGGESGWRDYLRKNLNPNVPTNNNAPAGKYTVIVKFIVTKDGTLKDVLSETYKGYGMDEEVIRIIKTGPNWIPAVQYGRKVNAYRRQPVTFLVEH